MTVVPAALWRHELRRCGWPALAAPGLTAAAAGLVASGKPQSMVYALCTVLEAAIPLLVGVVTCSLVGRDQAMELQLSTPTPYRGTLLRRATVVFAAGSSTGLAVGAVLAGWWTQPHGPLAGQLIWLAPAVLLAGLGLLAGALLREPAAAGAVVATVWLAEQLAPDRVPTPLLLFATTRSFHGDWAVNRAVLLVLGLVFGAVAWPILGRPGWLLAAEHGR